MNPFRKIARKMAMKMVLIVAAVVSVAATARAEWSTYQGNAAHTGYIPGNIDASHLSVKWSNFLPGGLLGGMAVGGNAVYVQGPLGSVSAFNEQSGAVLWSDSHFYGEGNGEVFSTSAPAYANGMVYYQFDAEAENNATTFLNLFNGVNAATGAQVFATPYNAQWETYLNPTPYGGNVYTGGGTNGGIYSYNAMGGAQNWFGVEGSYDGWTPAVDGKYAYSFTGTGPYLPNYGQFRMIDLATGSTTYLVTDTGFQWSTTTMNSAVVLGTHNDAFAINEPGSVNQIMSFASRLISFSTQADATHTPHIAWVLTDHFTGQPTLANGVLYADDGGNVVALDELTGNTLWSWTPPNGILGGPMIATDNVLFLTTSTTTYALDLATHQVDWSYGISGKMAYSDDTLFVTNSSNGTLYAISTPEPSSAIGFVVIGFGLLMRSRRAPDGLPRTTGRKAL